jgi:hypothetical protein
MRYIVNLFVPTSTSALVLTTIQPSKKHAGISILVHRARFVWSGQPSCVAGVPEGHFRQNSYSNQQMGRAINLPVKAALPNNKAYSVAFLPCDGSTSTTVARCCPGTTKTVGLPCQKISSFLQLVKDNPGLGKPGLHRISCECGQVYITQTGRLINTRVKGTIGICA